MMLCLVFKMQKPHRDPFAILWGKVQNVHFHDLIDDT